MKLQNISRDGANVSATDLFVAPLVALVLRQRRKTLGLKASVVEVLR